MLPVLTSLIAFGPYVRSGQTEAKRIHQEYLTNTLQQDFIRNARQFLIDIERSTPKTSEVVATIMPNCEIVSNILHE